MAECNFNSENLLYCPNDEVVGGVSVEFLYAPASHFVSITKPTITETSTYAERITLANDAIVFEAEKGWKKAQMLVDENELKNTFVGAKGNKKPQVSFDAFLPNFIAKNIGFFDAHANTPMVWLIPDSTGKKWLIGNLDTPAFFDKAEGTSGKTYDNNSGHAITVMANTKLYYYPGDATVLADPVV